VADDRWQGLLDSLAEVERSIRRITAVNVNTGTARDAARSLVQDYFRGVRPDLTTLGFGDTDLAGLDDRMQHFLQLANGRNARGSYINALRRLRQEIQGIEFARERRLGEQRGTGPTSAVLVTDVESRIIITLQQLVPTAALSYEQAVRDLASSASRLSFRGTANELREALRETVDYLAPDADVMAAADFALEANQTFPTQRQKVRYVLRSRELPSAARRVPEETVSLIEELTGAVARASYNRTSLSAHIASTEHEVRQLKMYVDSVLAELLQVHAPPRDPS
jgi:hypothetical protein